MVLKEKRNGGEIALFLLAFIAYAVSYFGRNTFASCISAMTEGGVLAAGADGLISSAYLICYGSGQLINGFVAMKLSPKLMIPAGLIGSGLCNVLMIAAGGNTAVYIALWAINGFCCSMLWPSVIRIFTLWMTKDERERSAASISPSIPVGSIICYLISFVMLRYGSWKQVFVLSGILLCTGGILLAVYMKAIGSTISKRDAEGRSAIAEENRGKAPKMAPAMIITFGLGIMIAASFFNGTLKEAVLSWVPKFLSQRHGMSDSSAALVSTLIPAFSVTGPYFAAWVNRRFFDNECKTIALLMAISAAANALILTGAGTALTVAMLALSASCMWGVNTMLMTYTTYHFSRMGLSTAVSGLLNCTVFIGSSGFTVLYGRLADGFGWTCAVIAWVACGVVAAAACLAGSGTWKRRRPEA